MQKQILLVVGCLLLQFSVTAPVHAQGMADAAQRSQAEALIAALHTMAADGAAGLQDAQAGDDQSRTLCATDALVLLTHLIQQADADFAQQNFAEVTKAFVRAQEQLELLKRCAGPAQERGASRERVAQDVHIQIAFNPQLVKGYRLLGYDDRRLTAPHLKDTRKEAGELRAGGTVTALYEVVPAGSPEPLTGAWRLKSPIALWSAPALTGELATVHVQYKAARGWFSQEMALPVHDAGGDFATASEDLRFAAAVACWGMLLRDSPFKGFASFERVADWARGAVGMDAEGQRALFVRLVEQAASLKRIANRQ